MYSVSNSKGHVVTERRQMWKNCGVQQASRESAGKRSADQIGLKRIARATALIVDMRQAIGIHDVHHPHLRYSADIPTSQYQPPRNAKIARRWEAGRAADAWGPTGGYPPRSYEPYGQYERTRESDRGVASRAHPRLNARNSRPVETRVEHGAGELGRLPIYPSPLHRCWTIRKVVLASQLCPPGLYAYRDDGLSPGRNRSRQVWRGDGSRYQRRLSRMLQNYLDETQRSL